jgi:curved DNA-binding protein CbpA
MTVHGSDPYAILGVARSATQEQVRRAFRALMRQNHPDTRRPGDPAAGAASTATLQRLLAAYAILGDPDRRAQYDSRTTPHPPPATRTGPPAASSRDPLPQPPIKAGPVLWYPVR